MGPLQGGGLTLEPHLRVRGVRKHFADVAALDGLDLDVQRGEMFVLVGGSGSGKTTLLRCIAGFERPDDGTIRLAGRDMTALPPYRRPVNTMFQSYALFPHLSVARNVAFGLRGLPRGEVEARVAEMLGLVRLEGYGERRPDQLSGGQQQRVALARALARRPELLLLDEPLSALDRNLREATRQELSALQRRLGVTFVLVTHDQEEALTLATRIGVMQAGRLAQVGTPADIYERPASRFVAEFLGAANILRGVVRASDAGGALIALSTGGQVQSAMPAPAAVGHPVDVVLRPERLTLVPAGPAAQPNRLDARVAHAAYRGEALSLTLHLADGTALRVTRPLGDGLADLPAAGEALTVAWSPAAAVLLTA